MKILLKVTETQVNEYNKRKKCQLIYHNREGYLGHSQDWKSLRNQVSGTGPEELPPNLCLSLVGFILQVGSSSQVWRGLLEDPHSYFSAWQLQKKRASFSQSPSINPRKDLKPYIPISLNKVSQLLLCIKIISGAFENSDSQVPPAEIPIQWLEKPHERGKRWFSKTKGH